MKGMSMIYVRKANRFCMIMGLLLAALSLLLVLIPACATIQPTPLPDYCAGSVYASNPGLFDQTMTGLVIGVNSLAILDAAKYQQARQVSAVCVEFLSNDSILITPTSLGEFTTQYQQWALIVSPLLALYSPSLPLSRCDREVLVKYLRMISG
jgi:hypothetical protein